MKRLPRIAAVLLASVLLTAPAGAASGQPAEETWIVYAPAPIAEQAGEIEAVRNADGYYLVYGSERVERLRENGRILSAAQDRLPTLQGENDASSDPGQALQWYLEPMGLSAAQRNGLDGSGVTIAIIDSGCRLSHEDLREMRLKEAKDFLSGGDSVEDTVRHGTAVTGILAAAPDNGIGIAGLAPNADYMILRAFSEDGGKESTLVSAVGYAINEGADVINMSLGSASESQRDILQPILDVAAQKGCIVVAAVGNSGKTEMLYPAGCAGVIGVGSSRQDGSVSSSSNHNSSVDILAPGDHIYTLSAVRDNTYSTLSGTSFAAPMISGLAAWAKQTDPGIGSEAFLRLLRDSAVDGGSTGYDTRYGWGIVDGTAFTEVLLEGCGSPVPEQQALPFVDVGSSDRFRPAVEWAYRSGLMLGTDATHFSPDSTLTRGMVAVMLCRYADIPAGGTPEVFSDIAAGQWYADAVGRCAASGIVAGFEDGTFRPNGQITREQLLLILQRCAAWYGADSSADTAALSAVPDSAAVDSWARDAAAWAVSNGLLADGTEPLRPREPATRAEAADFFYAFDRFLNP